MPLNHVAYFTGKNSIKGLIVIHFIFFRVNRTLKMLCGIHHDKKKQKKPFCTAFLIALGVWENLRYYGE